MNTFFKRTAVSLVVAGMTSFAYAAPAPAPMQMNGFFIGVEGLDLRPMNGDLDYYSVNQTNALSTRANSTDYDWGWRLFGGVKFGDNDDVTVSWFRLRSSSSDDVSFNNSNSVRYIGTNAIDASSKVDFDVDEVYAVLGHTIHFNNPWSVRFAGGLEYAKLDSDLKVNADFDNTNNIGFQPSIDAVTSVSKSDMKGWGPRAEFDATYHLGSNFAIFANTNAALLVADRDVKNEWFVNSNFDGELTFSDRHVIVPKLGMRLGASYTYEFGQAGAEGASCSSLTLAAGWQVESYIHAVERLGYSNSDLPDTKVSNFGDQGLFLGLTYNSGWM